jgi:hypothetical protein
MQRAEMEELRHREANNTALQAIGPRKKLKLDPDATTTAVSSTSKLSSVKIFKFPFFPGRNNYCCTIRHQSNRATSSTHQASKYARHDILHGAGEGQLSQQHAVQGLSQVINRWPAQMLQHRCYVFLLIVFPRFFRRFPTNFFNFLIPSKHTKKCPSHFGFVGWVQKNKNIGDREMR